ncbi:MAG: hypothetical protein N2515_01295 [Deltaproteobacteria bacterium]|nr:hypothetical protein [Deltaproteobacteria bacterium]
MSNDSSVDRLAQACEEEAPRLAEAIRALDESGRRELEGVLGRLASAKSSVLSGSARLSARRLLVPIRNLHSESLALLNKCLDYLDINADGRLDQQEVELASACIEAFASLSPPGHTLSVPELQLLYSVLRALDRDDDHRLDSDEQARLRQGIADIRWFLEDLRVNNPKFQPPSHFR